MLSLIIPGPPCAKGRPRFTRFGHAYTPKKTESAESTIRAVYAMTYPDAEPLAGPLAMQVKAYFPVPKSANKALREFAERECLPYCKKPDADNVGKLCADALNGVAYRDDATIYQFEVWKYYSTKPRLEVHIRELNDLHPAAKEGR